MSLFVKNIADIQMGVKVEGDTYFEAVDPYLEDAEIQYIKPYLGAELFEAMSDAGYDPAKLAKVSKWLKIAASCFAFYHIIQEGSLKINEHGAKQSTSEKSAPPPKWRDDNQKAELIKRGDNALDNLLEVLMENPTDFAEFASSKWYKLKTTLMISSAKDFHEFVPIGQSTRVFLRLLPDINKANNLLDSYICADLPARIKDYLADPSGEDAPGTEAIENLMPYLQSVIAYETVIRAIPRFNFFFTPDGIMLYSISDSTFQKMASTSADRKEHRLHYTKMLDEAVASLKGYLAKNLDDFPEYANSTCSGVKSSSRNPSYAFNNLPGQKYFAP